MGNFVSTAESCMPHEVAMAVLKHLDWKSRGVLLMLDRTWAFDIARDPQTWHFMCERLEIERSVFIPALDSERRSEWKHVFQKMAAFHALQQSGADQSFAIKVCVRFRPPMPAAPRAGVPTDKAKHLAILKSLLVRKEESLRRSALGECEDVSPTIQAEIAQIKHEISLLEPPRMVSLPLHQRLQLIQAEHGCSVRKARQILGDLMRSGQDHDPWSGAVLPEDTAAGGGEKSSQAVVGSSAFTKAARSELLQQDGLSDQQRLVVDRLQAAPSTATATAFVEQEVGRWLNMTRSPRRIALAAARMERGVLLELHDSLENQRLQQTQVDGVDPQQVDRDERLAAELSWQADDERRRTAVMEAKAEILRLEQISIEEETARVNRDIALLRGELNLPPSVPAPAVGPVVNSIPPSNAGDHKGPQHKDDPPPAPGAQPGVLSSSSNEVWCADPSKGIRAFQFDCVFNGHDNQVAVHENSAADAVVDLLNGVNGCVFAYGQTGSGKSHTMFGDDSTDLVLRPPPPTGTSEPQAVQEARIRGVFGDEVTDLLYCPPPSSSDVDDAAAAPVMTLNAAHTVLSGALDRQVHTEEEMSKLLQQAEGAKRRAATFMNARSSRAHSLLFLNLVQTTTRSSADEETESVVKRSQLCLADLGGSEQVKKSGVEGERLQEAVNINLGLLSLKNVISHLHRKAHYIPFSDNRLTELLREALGGRSKTVVIVTARLEPSNAAETLHALRFGERCRQISETVGGGATMATALALIESLSKQIADCESRIEADERWETRTIVTHEQSTNLFTGESEMVENRKVVSVLVGAEEHRAELERLLAQRSALLGH